MASAGTDSIHGVKPSIVCVLREDSTESWLQAFYRTAKSKGMSIHLSGWIPVSAMAQVTNCTNSMSKKGLSDSIFFR